MSKRASTYEFKETRLLHLRGDAAAAHLVRGECSGVFLDAERVRIQH